MLDDLERLLTFNAWANRRALETLDSLGDPPARTGRLLAHLVETERVWIDRFDGVSADTAPWPDWTLATIETAMTELEGRWTAFLRSTTEAALRQPFDYQNTSGEPFRSEPADVLLHVVLHAQEHRGQIGWLVGEAGGEWQETQYAWWRREGA